MSELYIEYKKNTPRAYFATPYWSSGHFPDDYWGSSYPGIGEVFLHIIDNNTDDVTLTIPDLETDPKDVKPQVELIINSNPTTVPRIIAADSRSMELCESVIILPIVDSFRDEDVIRRAVAYALIMGG